MLRKGILNEQNRLFIESGILVTLRFFHLWIRTVLGLTSTVNTHQHAVFKF